MFAKNVYLFGNLPVEQKQRRWTDCFCTIFAAILAITLFIIACASFNRQHYLEVNYPVESTGKICHLQLNTTPFIYFRNVRDFTKQRYCVSACPKSGEQIKCNPGTNCTGVVSTYETSQTIHDLGKYCAPTDQSLQTPFWSNEVIKSKVNSVYYFDIVLSSFPLAVCLGLIYLIVFLLIPKIKAHLVFVLCSVTLFVVGIICFVQPVKLLEQYSNTWSILLGIGFIILAIIFLAFLSCHRAQIELASIFLYYSNEFLKQNWILFLYIPLFCVFSVGLILVIIGQYISFSSINSSTWKQSEIYRTIQQQVFLQVLNFIEFVWGIQFIRDSFNYIISGNAVEWYFNQNNNKQRTECSRPVNRLLCKNWGSVVGGSFINAFFNLFGIFFDIVRCDSKGSFGKSQRNCRNFCCCLTPFIDLARADTYAYIHLTGIPYCNAARQCQAICEQTNLFSNNQTCIRLYRIGAQIFVVSLSVLLAFILFKAKISFVNLLIIVVVICICYVMGTHFVDIHSNAAQGLVTCYLVEANYSVNEMNVCPQTLRNDVYQYEQAHNLFE